MSGRPILICGPPDAGVVKYARKYGWAYVVDKLEQELLIDAIVKLSQDTELQNTIVKRAREVALMNHDVKVVRVRFQNAFYQALKKYKNKY